MEDEYLRECWVKHEVTAMRFIHNQRGVKPVADLRQPCCSEKTVQNAAVHSSYRFASRCLVSVRQIVQLL